MANIVVEPLLGYKDVRSLIDVATSDKHFSKEK